MHKNALFWFRNDLRLDDNKALDEAVKNAQNLLMIYIWDETLPPKIKPGAASKWWIQKSLDALRADLQARGGDLLVLKGDPLMIIPDLVQKYRLDALYLNKTFIPPIDDRDENLAEILKDNRAETYTFNSHLLFAPFDLRTKTGKVYQVFTPLYKTILAENLVPQKLIDAPKHFSCVNHQEQNVSQEKPLPWHEEFEKTWQVGEKGGRAKFKAFCEGHLKRYKEGRDFFEEKGFSKMSPYFAHGNVAVSRVWHILTKIGGEQAAAYQRQMVWREFAYYLLHHFPQMGNGNMREEFDAFPWREDAADFKAWCMGTTGCNIVDAAMRQLWRTGFMANRARLVVGSYLCKNMLMHWHHGERWFYDTLVDADYAVNVMNWQWVSGTGVDSAPYFRIFNPSTQAEKFDADGIYQKRWLEDLKHVPQGYAQERPQNEMMPHAEARERALAALKSLKH